MFKIMAMEHVNTFSLKLYSYFHCLLRFYRNCVLPSLFIFRWFLSLPGEHFKLCSMNMEWMNHPTHVIRLVVKYPYLCFSLSYRDVAAVGIKLLSIYRYFIHHTKDLDFCCDWQVHLILSN